MIKDYVKNVNYFTRPVGLEPTTSGFGDLRSTNWTKDASQNYILALTGFEPVTKGLWIPCSTTELQSPRNKSMGERRDLNPRMKESQSFALPLGDARQIKFNYLFFLCPLQEF